LKWPICLTKLFHPEKSALCFPVTIARKTGIGMNKYICLFSSHGDDEDKSILADVDESQGYKSEPEQDKDKDKP